MEETAKGQWGQIENAYQRRAELVPKLTSIASGLGISKGSIDQLKQAQASANMSLSTDDLTTENIQKFNEAQTQFGKKLSGFLKEISSQTDFNNQTLMDFQAQIEGAENRINFERKKYNDRAREYNSYINQVPQNFTSGMMGFDEMPYFEADKGAK